MIYYLSQFSGLAYEFKGYLVDHAMVAVRIYADSSVLILVDLHYFFFRKGYDTFRTLSDAHLAQLTAGAYFQFAVCVGDGTERTQFFQLSAGLVIDQLLINQQSHKPPLYVLSILQDLKGLFGQVTFSDDDLFLRLVRLKYSFNLSR